MVACQVYEPMPTPYTRYWPYMELFAPKTINILALLKRHNVTPAIYSSTYIYILVASGAVKSQYWDLSQYEPTVAIIIILTPNKKQTFISSIFIY